MPGNFPDPPPSVIASWPTPNYVDPPTLTWMTPFAVTLTAVASLCIVVRLYLRLRNEGGGLGLDDALLIPAWLLSIVFTGLVIWAADAHFVGRHIWDTLPSTFELNALSAWIAQLIFVVGTCALKLSALFFFRRIQSGTYNRKWMFAIWAAIGFTIAYSLALAFALIFNCRPTEAYWRALDPTYKHKYACTDTVAVDILAPVLSVVSDIYAVVLPCMMLQGLELARRQRIMLNTVFAVSFIVAGAGIGRTYYFASFLWSYDLPWIGYWLYFWSILEYQLGIICACLPNLRVFLKRYIGTYVRSSKRTGHSRADSDAELTSMHNGTLPGTVTSYSSRFSADPTHGEKVPTSKTIEVDAGSYPDRDQGKHDSSQQPMPRSPSIRTPKEYEDHVIAITARSRKSFNFGSVRGPRVGSDTDKDLPPVPPSPHTIEHGAVSEERTHWPLTHYEA